MKRPVLVVSAAVLAVIAWWLLRRDHQGPEPEWSISVASDVTGTMPWRDVHLTASIANADASGWRWGWDSDGAAFATQARGAAVWRSGKKGPHKITVSVTSPWGTTRTASVDLQIMGATSITSGIPGQPPVAEVPSHDDAPYGFADVWVEKSSVCRGEPSRIRATPFYVGGNIGHLRAATAGRPGLQAVVQEISATPGVQRIPVSVWDQDIGIEHAVTTYVYIEVKDCIAPHAMFVNADVVRGADGRELAELSAHLMDGPKLEAEARWPTDDPRPRHVDTAASFRWSLGDGTTEVSKAPGALSVIRHAYPDEEHRPIDDYTTLYAISVEALDEHGQTIAVGHTTLELVNLSHQIRAQHGTIFLETEYLPYSEHAANGDLWLAVKARNPDPEETVHLTEIQLSLMTCDGKALEPQLVPAARVFKDLEIAPGAAVAGKWTWSDHRAGLCYVTGKLIGTTPNGLIVNGTIAMTVGVPPSRQRVEDPARLAELQKAMSILGKQNITDKELEQLRADGKLSSAP